MGNDPFVGLPTPSAAERVHCKELIAQRDRLLEMLKQATKCIQSAVRIEQCAHDEPPCPVSELDAEADRLAHECLATIAEVEASR